jgi:hypothetical protein
MAVVSEPENGLEVDAHLYVAGVSLKTFTANT